MVGELQKRPIDLERNDFLNIFNNVLNQCNKHASDNLKFACRVGVIESQWQILNSAGEFRPKPRGSPPLLPIVRVLNPVPVLTRSITQKCRPYEKYMSDQFNACKIGATDLISELQDKTIEVRAIL